MTESFHDDEKYFIFTPICVEIGNLIGDSLWHILDVRRKPLEERLIT